MTEYAVIYLTLTLCFSLFEMTPLLYEVQSKCYSYSFLRNPTKYLYKTYGFLFILGVIFSLLYPIGIIFDFSYIFSICYSIAFLFIKLLLYERILSTKKKGNLVYTKRLKRLLILTVFLLIIFVFLMLLFAINHFVLCVVLLPILQPIFLYIALIILSPFERLNNKKYIDLGRKKLGTFNCLTKIAITGSFGKTSVKNILCSMLEKKYNVVATEGNFNTPLGITKTIDKINSLTDIFIAEMGARHVGDIKELVDIVSPDIAVVTGITSQHLETFGSFENIVREKMSIFDAPNLRFRVINRNGVKDIRDGAISYVGSEGDIVYAKELKCSENGSSFILSINGNEYPVKTRLLGAHNIDNIVTAVSVAVFLNVEIDDILSTIESLKPTPHRLELIKNDNITIIDDTYNANPKGVREALNVLKYFPNKRIVVTPGMVELGDMTVRENYSFGRDMVGIADVVILIGESPARHIYNGLVDGGFDEKKILRYESLEIAEKFFKECFSAGDTVMFINDLPDIYN